MTGILDRIAGAPITWGVCEVSGWGVQLPPSRVLAEMAEIGLRATELGPEGYLPSDRTALRDLLDRHGLALVAGFLPAVLHEPDLLATELGRVGFHADLLADAGGSVLVLAAAMPPPTGQSNGGAGYDALREIDDAAWTALLPALDTAATMAVDRGISLALHPHLGTAVVTGDHVERVLDGSNVDLCIDTGHLTAGGSDPIRIAREAAGRVAHVHLKDVDGTWGEGVRTGRISYADGVRGGMYRPLGQGDLDVRAFVHELEAGGYGGWYVLEQDTILDAVPEEGAGPRRDAEASLQMLRRLASAAEADLTGTWAGRTRAAREATSLGRGEG